MNLRYLTTLTCILLQTLRHKMDIDSSVKLFVAIDWFVYHQRSELDYPTDDNAVYLGLYSYLLNCYC